jgi:hypothetical protein
MKSCDYADYSVVIVKGELPGVAKQSSLFVDNLGHPQKPLRDMASYSKLELSEP